MVDGSPDVHAGNSRAGGIGDCGLGPDGSLEEGQEDVRDGLDRSENQGVSASVNSGSKREGASLALWHVGRAKDLCCGSQQLISIVGAEGNLYVKWFQNENN